MKAAHLIQGEDAETACYSYLKLKGLKLVEKNFSCRFGEIDIVMLDNKTLVFVEVRFRKNNLFGGGLESITATKQQKLRKTAELYSNVNLTFGIAFGISIKKSYKHCFTFRNAGYKSKATKRDLIIPVFVDPLTKVLDKKNIRVLKKQERPIIGFVGQATNNIFKRFKDISYTLILNCARSLKLIYNDKQSIFPAVYNRYQLIKSLEANKEIETKFILYQKYRAGSKTVEDKKRSTFTFLNNMIESNYIFCVRGTGNFSVRFYEALAMGRIPVLFNTDSMLPLKDEISWNDHILIIDKHDDIAEKLISFHKNVSSEAFENIQKKNRDLSVSHLSIINYFKIIYQLIRTKKAPFN